MGKNIIAVAQPQPHSHILAVFAFINFSNYSINLTNFLTCLKRGKRKMRSFCGWAIATPRGEVVGQNRKNLGKVARQVAEGETR